MYASQPSTLKRPAFGQRLSALFQPSTQLVRETFAEWSEDHAPRLGAALAYYTVFSLAPLMIIALAIVGLFVDSDDVQGRLNSQFQDLLGKEGADAVLALVAAAKKPTEGTIATVVGFVALAFGAVGVFIQLKDAMNTIWNVERKQESGVWSFLRNYVVSFAMVLGIGFLLLVLLAVSAIWAGFSETLTSRLGFLAVAGHAIELTGSFIVVALLFALIFKYLPDVKIAWTDVWLGAIVTSVLFSVGKFAIGMYLGHASFKSSYGAAGTVLIVLAWTYYSAQILFLGAEFTQVYARHHGSRVQPTKGSPSTSQKAV